MPKAGILLFFLAAMLYGASCKQPGNIQSVSGDTLAKVTNVDLMREESFPVKIKLKIQGELQDTCTKFRNISQDKKDNLFIIHLVTDRDPNAKCNGEAAPFEVEVPLQVNGLQKGKYEVDVNGVKKSFTLEQDNWIEGDE